MNSPKVIHVHGRAKVAYLEGERIDREEDVFVPSEQGWFKTIDTDNHFVYRQGKRKGSTLMCTCGGIAGIFMYDAYRKFSSINRGRIVACVEHMNSGIHSDGSS
jgi:hypothetical protein